MHRINCGGLWGLVLAVAGQGLLLAQSDDFVLRVEGPPAQVSTGSAFDATVRLDADLAGVQGWSFGVAHDPEAFALLSAEEGATTLTASNGNPPTFVVIDTEPAAGSGVTMAVVISFTRPIVLPIGNDYELLKMRYSVLANPGATEPCVPRDATLAFSDELGDPPVQTVLTVEGNTTVPATEDTIVTVRCPGSLEIARCEGDEENIYLEWTFANDPRWHALYLYRDGELQATLDPAATSYTDLGLEEPAFHVYTILAFVVEDPANPTLISAYCEASIIPVTLTAIEPAIGYWAGGDEVTVRGKSFTTLENTTLRFVDGSEELPLEILAIVGPEELRARTPRATRLGLVGLRMTNERGSTDLPSAFEYGFIRGEANADRNFDLSDAIFVLNWLFQAGSPPLCEDAADTTDDGRIDISDGIRIVTYLFSGTGAPPPAPYPDPGQDGTADTLGCLLGAQGLGQ